MNQSQHCISSRHRQASDVSDSSDRGDERRAAVAQMMAENKEGLGMKVIAVLVQRYGVLPRELWDLNSISDMGAGRGVTYDERVSKAMLESISSNQRYSIINLNIVKVTHMVTLPTTLRKLKIWAEEYNYPLVLPTSLQKLVFGLFSAYSQPLVLPSHLLKLVLGRFYNSLIDLPPKLVELELGSAYTCPLILPLGLKRLDFESGSQFNLPLDLPSSLVSVDFGIAYNQPTILPLGIESIRVGSAFTHDLWLPPTLRKIAWWCNRPLHIPDGVSEVELGSDFNLLVTLPTSIKKAFFFGKIYSHPLNFPEDLEELAWSSHESDELVLPERLQKLTWASDRAARLPATLRELIIESDAPLVMPEGLVKVTFECPQQIHYDLPESVREVTWSNDNNTFTHPTTLQHIIVNFSCYDALDLSHIRIHKLTIEDGLIRIAKWPKELKELEFTVDYMEDTLRVPKGCKIVGEKRPENIIME